MPHLIIHPLSPSSLPRVPRLGTPFLATDAPDGAIEGSRRSRRCLAHSGHPVALGAQASSHWPSLVPPPGARRRRRFPGRLSGRPGKGRGGCADRSRGTGDEGSAGFSLGLRRTTPDWPVHCQRAHRLGMFGMVLYLSPQHLSHASLAGGGNPVRHGAQETRQARPGGRGDTGEESAAAVGAYGAGGGESRTDRGQREPDFGRGVMMGAYVRDWMGIDNGANA